jgi:peptidoglycan-N-acetylglucosamine deacetylase
MSPAYCSQTTRDISMNPSANRPTVKKSNKRLPPLSLDVCLTVDLEPDCPPYLWTWRGLREGAPALLDLLARHEIAATFFTTGETAAHFPKIVEALVSAGHELACHGMTHQPFTELSSDRADWEITQSAQILRQFANVGSFRAPYLRFPPLHLRLLERAGFIVDSSQAKYKPTSLRPTVTSLLRIPVSVTSSVLRLPALIRDPWLNVLKPPVVLFVHPWEFVDLTTTDLRLDCRFRTGKPALRALESVIALFKNRGARFCRIDTLAEDMRSDA